MGLHQTKKLCAAKETINNEAIEGEIFVIAHVIWG
jgi:hypothetical protein